MHLPQVDVLGLQSKLGIPDLNHCAAGAKLPVAEINWNHMLCFIHIGESFRYPQPTESLAYLKASMVEVVPKCVALSAFEPQIPNGG